MPRVLVVYGTETGSAKNAINKIASSLASSLERPSGDGGGEARWVGSLDATSSPSRRLSKGAGLDRVSEATN